ncbi:unnamed protein product [Effrenium voratum]|uniref:Uncharacterized protein n=1 Tax=Effrenium voratum TaxID=2562239 RepID=A0AA36JPU6_9DINO|nr:unnamed protein product [Effrenium voratum]CAJ1446040.1 unnamed protein product [Effrenium voratum]
MPLSKVGKTANGCPEVSLEKSRSASAGRLRAEVRPVREDRQSLTPTQPLVSKVTCGAIALPRPISAERIRPSATAIPVSARRAALTERRGEKALVLQKDLQNMEERLATAERERDWAMTALRQSESELQKLLAQRCTGDAVSDVRLNHYRVLLELLNLRCRLLEQWIEEEAALMAQQERHHAEALRRMEQQVQELATEVVEQQAAFQEQVAAMSAQQERIEQQHCEDFSLWSDELLRSREKAAEELGLLREDMQRQDQLWHQEWTRMQQDASRQGIDVADPPGFLQLEEAQEPRDDPEKPGPNGWTESLEGRATLATIPEAESEEVQAQTPGGKSAARSPEQPKAQVPSPTSRSGSSPSSVPEDLMKSLEKASDDKQASRAWARIGQFHQRQKSFDQARQAYQSAVRLDNSQHGCLANLAQLEAHAGHVSTAKEMLAAALRLEPSNKNYISFSRWLSGAS